VLPIRPIVLALMAAGCQSLIGIEDSPPMKSSADAGVGGAGGAIEAGAGSAGQSGAASGGTGGAPDAGCGSARWPSPPTGAEPGDALDLVFAIRELDFGDRDQAGEPSWRRLGYDLDQLCTCGTDPEGACMPLAKTPCDGLDGRDNAVGTMLYDLRHSFGLDTLDSEAFTGGIEAGGRTVLLRVSGYNGKSDDAQVRVGWYSANGFGAANPGQNPKWDGSDEWPIFSASLEPQTGDDGGAEYSLDKPKYFDDAAYVSGGTLVASIPEGIVALADNVAIRFSAAFLTGRLEQDTSGQWRLEDGVLAGISRVKDALATLAFLDFANQPICTNHLAYELIKARICGFSDMYSLFPTPTKPCDSLSLGFGLRAHPAKLGIITVVPDLASPCSPDIDPANDSCG
jgi:hypothetical protein